MVEIIAAEFGIDRDQGSCPPNAGHHLAAKSRWQKTFGGLSNFAVAGQVYRRVRWNQKYKKGRLASLRCPSYNVGLNISSCVSQQKGSSRLG